MMNPYMLQPLVKHALTAVKKKKEYVNERTRVWTTGPYNLGLIGPLYHPRASDEEMQKDHTVSMKLIVTLSRKLSSQRTIGRI